MAVDEVLASLQAQLSEAELLRFNIFFQLYPLYVRVQAWRKAGEANVKVPKVPPLLLALSVW